MTGSLPPRADVVIVGAGLAGAATAHELHREGRSVLVLERQHSPGLEASGRSASMVREDVGDEALRPLAAEGAAMHRAGRLAPFRPTGSFLFGRGDEDVSSRIPRARGRGLFFPGDGVVASGQLLRALLDGPTLACGVEVSALEPARGGVAVVTSRGSVVARVAVNAAGAWAGRLGRLPLEPRKRHLFVTGPVDASESWPFAWDDEAGYYFRPQGDALLLCACDERACEPGDNAVDGAVKASLVQKLVRWQPDLIRGAGEGLELRETWAGQRTFAPDDRFVVGWDERVEGVFHLCGLGGHGVTVSPALGRLAARMIHAGPDALAPEVARPLAPARFGSGGIRASDGARAGIR